MDPFIAKHLEGVSRTYALVVPMLPPPLDDTVGLAYLTMRIVDTVEDAPQLSDNERDGLAATLDAALDGDVAAARTLQLPIGDLPAERSLMADAPEVFARVQALGRPYRCALCTCARTMTAGVRKLLERARERDLPYPAVRDLPELREYCYYVAGTVGEMLCCMMTEYLDHPVLLDSQGDAIELGLGLQLVNITKDAPRDATQGRRYLPLISADGAAAARIYQDAIEEARRCLDRGIAYVLRLPAKVTGLRAFCGLPMVWGALTLARAEHDQNAAKVGRDTIRDSITLFDQIARDDERLERTIKTLIWSPGVSLSELTGVRV